MSSPLINKIHVTNTTGLSLHERFTALATEPVRRRSRSRSRSRARQPPAPRVDPATSMANARLLRQLARKHTMQTALKLKRRSLRATGAGLNMKRGNIKSLRVGPNGRALTANSKAKIAAMRSHMVRNGSGRALRPSNSRIRPDVKRLGARRPIVGGAAERVAQRRLKRLGTQPARVARPRSRSRVRVPIADAANGRQIRQGRSMSRGRAPGQDRSRSRTRGRINNATNAISIKSRLGVRPGARGGANNARRGRNNRAASLSRRGPATGRIQKRRNSVAPIQKGGGAGIGGRMSRARGRAMVKNASARAPSQIRKGSVGQLRQRNRQQSAQGSSGVARDGRQRGRNPQRNGRAGQQRNGRIAQTNGKNGKPNPKANAAKNGPQQQRRGRSRSRAAGRGGRNLGKNQKQQVNKDDLDKELDQYMATTKTENDMDYLLH